MSYIREKKKIVALDMDDTILWLTKEIQMDHNRKFPSHYLNYHEVIPFKEDNFHPEYDKMDYFLAPDTFLDLEAMPNAVQEIKKIHQDYDVIIVTASFPENVVDKWKWLQKYLPFIPFRNFIVATRKDLIQADILIDDAVHNIKDWVATGRPILVPEHHWNQHLSELEGVTMFKEWKGLKQIIDNLLVSTEESMMMWLDRRLEHSDKGTFPVYAKQFKKMWVDEFGTFENVPKRYKDKIYAHYKKLSFG